MLRPVSFLVLILSAGMAAAQDRPAHRVGFRLAKAQGGGDSVPLAVWYPTQARRLIGYVHGAFRLRVAKDAKPAAGRFGLIAISHGTGGGFLNHRSVAAALATRVVAPESRGSTRLC